MKPVKKSQAPADPSLAPDYRSSVSDQLYGFEDGPIKSMDGVNDPVFDLLMFGKQLFRSGVVDSVQEGVQTVFNLAKNKSNYSIKQLIDRLPATVSAFVAEEELEDVFFNNEEEK